MNGTCAGCAGQGMYGTRGTRGLGAIVMEPLRGGVGDGATSAVSELMAGAGIAAPGAMMLGSAIYGGALGGLSGGSWKAAGTGALLAAGLTGLGAGASVVGFSMMTQDGVVEADVGAKVAGGAYALAGLGLLIWGGVRAYRTIKKR